MKKILFALILCLPLSIFAQNKQSTYRTTKVIPTIYSEIVLTTISPEKQKVAINFSKKNLKELKYSEAAKGTYETVLDAMNALSREGYKFVDSYEVEGKEYTYTHFIMGKDGNTPPPPPSKGTKTQAKGKIKAK